MSTKVSEVAISGGLLGLGTINYLGGREIAKDFKEEPLMKNVRYRAIKMKNPALAKLLKVYPSVLKTTGMAGMVLGGACLAYSIFASNEK